MKRLAAYVLKASAIKFVTAKWVTYMGKMYPYLVGPSGFRADANSCEHAVCRNGFIFCDGRLAGNDALGAGAEITAWEAII